MRFLLFCLLVVGVLLSVFSCDPAEEVLTSRPDAMLHFSADSLQFDTVFTQTGSVTKRLLVYNLNKLSCNSVWPADKPHVLFGEVRVKAGCRLTIEKGARIYAHAKAALLVAGSLQVAGTAAERVVFDGDRLESFYDDIPGQWAGIRLLPGSTGNRLRYADIRNAEVGLLADNADQDAGDFDLILEHCILRNMYADGIRSFSADVQAINTLITNCGVHAVQGLGGGTYDFKFCTIANFTPAFNRTTPSLAFSDRRPLDGGGSLDYRIKVSLVNSIVWGGRRSGRLTEELLFLTEAATRLDTALTYNILQTELYRPTLNNTNKFNADPQFNNAPGQPRPVYPYDYSIAASSPANDAASPLAAIILDINDKPRHPVSPDIGAYELP
jgi:hypothetical protein